MQQAAGNRARFDRTPSPRYIRAVHAITVDRPGDESVLKISRLPSPQPAHGELKIQVAAAGVNRADLLQRRGLYPPPPGASPLLGLECAGTVTEVGEGVNRFRPGERVMALLSGGGYAEEVVAPEPCTMAVPTPFTDAEAAAVPEVFLTAFLNLFLIAGLKRNETALVHGGSGGVGTASIQLVRRAGARVIVTAGSDERCQRCEELGASHAVNYRRNDFGAAVLELTENRGVDVVLDCIGGAYFETHLNVLAPGGRMVLIGLQGGAGASIDLAKLLRRRLTLTGSTLRSRPIAEKGRIVREFTKRFGPDLDRGDISPVLDRTLPLGSAEEAHRLLAAGEIFGKIVLTTNKLQESP